MNLHKAKLVTIIADEAISDRVLDDLRTLKVSGFTVSEATGEGLNRVHLSAWEGKNVRIETLVSAVKAEAIIVVLAQKYLDKFGLVVFAADVQVYRSGRFE